MKNILISVAAAMITFVPAALAQNAPTTRPADSGAKPAPGPRTRTAEQMLDEMLKPAPGTAATPGAVARPLPNPSDPPAADRTSGAGAVKPGAPVVTVLREGTFVVDRTGRLVRSADGSMAEIVFEADGRAMRDPPMVIVPNLKLMAMENAAASATRDLRFRISGMVTEYRGRNYILLEKVVVVPDPVQQF